MSVKKTLINIIIVVVAASLLGFANNLLNPNGVKIAFDRPAKEAADNSIFSQDSSDETTEAVVIDKEQLKELIAKGDVFLVDARDSQEFAQAKIPGAINIPFEMLGEFIDTIDNLPKTSWIVTYCDGPPCDKAQLLATTLTDMGFKHVAYYDAGLDDWKTTEDVEH